MPHFPHFRAPLSLFLVAAITLQAATIAMPRMARAEDTSRAMILKHFSWATHGLTLTGELLQVVQRSGSIVTIDATSAEKPSLVCFPIEEAPLPQVPTPTPEPTPEPVPTPVPTPTPVPVIPLSYTLSEAVSNPVSGSEWVEITISPTSATSTDRALELWDAAGRIASIAANTGIANGYLVVTLTSAKLNNSGDGLSLRTPEGTVLDETTIPSLEKGFAWARRGTTWESTSAPTAGAANQFPAPPASEPEPQPEPVTSPDETPEPTATSTPSIPGLTPDPTPSSAPILGPQLPLFLSEAMSRPADGPEWVELFMPTTAETTLGREVQLWDAAGRIATLGATTPVPASGYVLVTLSSAKLNNGGDELSLRTADGVILDSTSIPAVDEANSWMRTDDSRWIASTTPTPGMANASAIVLGATTNDAFAAATTDQTLSSSQTSDTLELDLTDMPTETFVNRRVRLAGTVGSIPNLLGSTHAFILLGENGRAAIVYVPKHLHVPPLGSTVRVMGTLTATVKQMELRMKNTDVWMTMATSTPPTPRLVDFLAPGVEDAWSLTTARGTVTKTATQSATLDVNGVEVTLSVPAAVGYRVARLEKGDVVQVTGLIDPRKTATTILPRTPEDIQLVEHAANSVTAPTAANTNRFPDWIPFGAAVGAVVSTGVAKRAYAFFKKKKLERLVIPVATPVAH